MKYFCFFGYILILLFWGEGVNNHVNFFYVPSTIASLKRFFVIDISICMLYQNGSLFKELYI